MRPGEPQMVQDVKWTITLDRTFRAPCLPLDSHLSCKKQIWQKPHNARRFPSPPFLTHRLASSMIYSLVLFFGQIFDRISRCVRTESKQPKDNAQHSRQPISPCVYSISELCYVLDNGLM